jgi:hypothetical protein
MKQFNFTDKTVIKGNCTSVPTIYEGINQAGENYKILKFTVSAYAGKSDPLANEGGYVQIAASIFVNQNMEWTISGENDPKTEDNKGREVMLAGIKWGDIYEYTDKQGNPKKRYQLTAFEYMFGKNKREWGDTHQKKTGIAPVMEISDDELPF